MNQGKFVKSLRDILSLKQKPFANKYSVTQGAVSNWEKNQKQCSGYLLLKFMTDAYLTNKAAFIRAFDELSKERASDNER